MLGKQQHRVNLPAFGAGDKQMPVGASGPVTAEVKSFPPLSGTMTGTVDVGGTLTIGPSPYFTATFSGFERRLANVEGKVSSVGSFIAANGPGSTGKSSPDAGKGGRD